jgi:hypothetical protein
MKRMLNFGLRNRKLAIPLLKGIWIYSLLLWGYIVADMFVFPQYQFSSISRLIPIPQNLIADVAFPISFLAFVLWEYLKKADSGESGRAQLNSESLRARNEIPR